MTSEATLPLERIAWEEAQEAVRRWYAVDRTMPHEFRRELPAFIHARLVETEAAYLAAQPDGKDTRP